MSLTSDLVEALGGERVVGKIPDESALETKLRRGLPFRSLERLVGVAGLSRQEAVRIAGIPERTFARRKDAKSLTFEESDRVAQFATLFALASNVLGGNDQAARWLHTQSPYLGRAPVERLDNTVGRNAVRDELLRIAYGMLA